MKILSVTATPLGDSAQSWRIWNIAHILNSSGHDVKIVQFTLKPPTNKLITIKPIDVPNSIIKSSPLTVHIKLYNEVKREKYDLVYGNTHWGTFCSILSRLKSIPIIFDMHGGLVEEFLLNNQSIHGLKRLRLMPEYVLDKTIELIDECFSSRIICVSHGMINYLHERKGIPLQKMAYVTNGVDLDFFRPSEYSRIQELKRQLGLEDKYKFFVGYIGAQDKWQGVSALVQAADMIKDPEILFIFVGGNYTRREGNKLFLPKVSRNQIVDYYSLCDILVLPRPSHPATEIAAPTKFAEYTAMGKPILTTNVGDAADMVKKYNCGIVVSNNSYRCLSEGIIAFKNRNMTDMRTMGNNSRSLAEKEFNWDKIAESLLAVINSVG